MKKSQHNHTDCSKAVIYVILGSVSYCMLSILVKLAYNEGYNVGDITGTQAILGAIFLAFLLILSSLKDRLPKPSLKQGFVLLLWGIPASLTGIFYYSSLQYISASLAIVFLFQFTWIGTLIDLIRHRRVPSTEEVVGLFLIFSGTVVASGLFQQDCIDFPWKGILFSLLSALSYSFFIFSTGTVAEEAHPLYKSFFMVTGSAITIAVLFPPNYFFDGTFSAGLWKWSLPLALFGMVIPPLAYAKGMPKISLALGSILGAIELPTAVLMARLVLQEEVSALQWAGVSLILLTIGLPYLFKKDR